MEFIGIALWEKSLLPCHPIEPVKNLTQMCGHGHHAVRCKWPFVWCEPLEFGLILQFEPRSFSNLRLTGTNASGWAYPLCQYIAVSVHKTRTRYFCFGLHQVHKKKYRARHDLTRNAKWWECNNNKCGAFLCTGCIRKLLFVRRNISSDTQVDLGQCKYLPHPEKVYHFTKPLKKLVYWSWFVSIDTLVNHDGCNGYRVIKVGSVKLAPYATILSNYPGIRQI